MSDRRLIVGEFDPADADNGKLFAIDPTDAKGIPLPAFDVGNARPTVGTLKGQAYYDTNQKQGFCWTGSAWQSFAPSPLLTYATESELQKDTRVAVGGYATAGDTGALFIRGALGWREVGVKTYSTATDLFGDNPSPGSLGEVLSEGSLWERRQNGWRLLIVREMADTTAIVAWDRTSPHASKGDQAYDKRHDVLYVRTSKNWRPVSIWEADEATIRAATWCLNGQEAIAGDTGRTFTRIRDQWIEEPINHFATEALLLAATAVNGTLAWSDDTNVVFTRAGNAWHRLQGPQISVGTTAPTTPGVGDLWHNTDQKLTRICIATTPAVKWQLAGGEGDLKTGEITIPNGTGTWFQVCSGLAPTNLTALYRVEIETQGSNAGGFVVFDFQSLVSSGARIRLIESGSTGGNTNANIDQVGSVWGSGHNIFVRTTAFAGQAGKKLNVSIRALDGSDISSVVIGGAKTDTPGSPVLIPAVYPLWIPAGTANDQVLKWDGDSWEATSLSATGASKLIAKKDLAFHHFAADTWEEVVSRWVKPASMGIPVGHLAMVIMTVKMKKYHEGSVKFNSMLVQDGGPQDSGWIEYTATGTSHPTAASVDRTLVFKVDDVDRKLFYAVNSYGTGGGNGDRQGWGYIVMWDMGPEPTADM